MIEYFYVMTIQALTPQGLTTRTQTGWMGSPDGIDNRKAFDEIRNSVSVSLGVNPADSVVLFWSLEKNDG